MELDEIEDMAHILAEAVKTFFLKPENLEEFNRTFKEEIIEKEK